MANGEVMHGCSVSLLRVQEHLSNSQQLHAGVEHVQHPQAGLPAVLLLQQLARNDRTANARGGQADAPHLGHQERQQHLLLCNPPALHDVLFLWLQEDRLSQVSSNF